MRTRLSTLAVILAFGGIRLFADCATEALTSDNTNGVYTTTRPEVGTGATAPTDKLHVFATDDANTLNLVENTNSTGLSAAGVVQGKADVAITSLLAHGSGRTTVLFGQTIGGFSELLNAAGDGLIVGTLGDDPLILGTNSTARMTIAGTGAITVPGNFTVTGTKNFAVVDPSDSNRVLFYAALEGPDTYYRGSAKTINGQIVIDLPGSFSRLTEKERMTVQITPVGEWGQLYVAEKSPERLVIKVAGGWPELQFDYLVQGVRKGYLGCEGEPTGMLPVVNH